MKRIIALDTWKRKEEYLFFRSFLNPMVSVTVEVDCTTAYRTAHEKGFPFSLYYLHAAIIAANRIEELRYRQEGDNVVLYDKINLVTPILVEDGNYRSVVLAAEEDWQLFLRNVQPVIRAAKQGEGHAHSERSLDRGFIVMSVNPWYHFTNVQVAIPSCPQENIPIFTFGKMEEKEGKRFMPVALSVNHGFVSGYQIGKFLEEFQRMLDR